ncbi:hypothetical protein [Chitinophaga arvensicola]|uniref:Uncharacterized protein n=1 Tax=Chitinophaga arvensicola TaxID=29529 RepID=A0A1I0PLK6_9BACT|nr:hypothetical protein [Chitinophaga arvensicola]SEW15297.1 hypothetical protein SAMN04488122_0856 [Chitinophaga arvensicola]
MKGEKRVKQHIVEEDTEQIPVSLVVDNNVIIPNRDAVCATGSHFFTVSHETNDYKLEIVQIGSGVQILNGSAEDFFRHAFNLVYGMEPEIAYELKPEIIDQLRQPDFRFPGNRTKASLVKEWRMQHCYCYQLAVTSLYKPLLTRMFWQDINNYFGVKYKVSGNILNIPKQHLVLRAKPTLNSSELESPAQRFHDPRILLLRARIVELSKHLPEEKQLPFALFSDIPDLIIKLLTVAKNLEELKSQLEGAGYLLRKEMVSVPKLYLKTAPTAPCMFF